MFDTTGHNYAAHKNITKSFLIASGGAFTRPIESTSVEYIGSIAAPITMSSKEIAELTGKEHFHVLRDIRKMLSELGGDEKGYIQKWIHPQNGQEYDALSLPRREVDILLTGYSVPLRAKVIDRWHELETEVVSPVAALDNKIILRGLLLSYTERVLALEYKISEDAKKVGFYDEVADTGELLSMDEVAKMLDTGRTRLYHYMRKHKILKSPGYKRKLPYQHHLDAGRFEVKWGKYKNRQTGEIENTPTPFFTGKGLIWIQQFIAKTGREGL